MPLSVGEFLDVKGYLHEQRSEMAVALCAKDQKVENLPTMQMCHLLLAERTHQHVLKHNGLTFDTKCS